MALVKHWSTSKTNFTMRAFPVVLLLLGAILSTTSARRSSKSRGTTQPHIVKGRKAKLGQFPFAASLRGSSGQHFCGGTVISPKWILTAAHCGVKVSDSTTVEVGMVKRRKGKVYKMDKWIEHEFFTDQFSDEYLKNDVALIKIKGTIRFNKNVQPIKLGHPQPDDSCLVTGWGKTEDQADPVELRYTEVKILKGKKCRRFEGYTTVGHGQVCSLDETGKSPCSGDSGGPLVLKNVLVGIVSYGYTPCGSYFPEVYTSPLAYSCWIAKQTGIPTRVLLGSF